MPGNPVKWTAAFASPISNPNSTSSPGTLSWMAGQQLPTGALSTADPALATSGGKIWCVHDDHLGVNTFWSTNYDFNQWTEESGIPGNLTYEAVGLTNWGSWLYCMYTGGDTYLYCIISQDGGTTWGGRQQVPNNRVASGPSIAVWNGQLYCAYRGLGEDGIWITRSNDGNGYSWDTAYRITVPGYTITTSSGPVLCAFQGNLWCVYRSMDAGFYTMTSDDGQSWSAPVWANSQYMDSPQALCVVPGQQGNPDTLLCVYGDSQGNNRFYYTYNTSGDPGDWQWGGTTSNLSRVNGTDMGLTVWNDIIFGAYMST